MEQKPAQCPFLKQAYIQERCDLYQALPIAIPGPLVGHGKVAQMRGCSITLTAFIMADIMNNLHSLAPPGRNIPN